MPYVSESKGDRSRRIRKGGIVAFLVLAFWIVFIGGIIYLINVPK